MSTVLRSLRNLRKAGIKVAIITDLYGAAQANSETGCPPPDAGMYRHTAMTTYRSDDTLPALRL